MSFTKRYAAQTEGYQIKSSLGKNNTVGGGVERIYRVDMT